MTSSVGKLARGLHRPRRLSSGPALVDIELTNRCNLRCSPCWFYGTNGVGDRYGTSEMSTDEVLALIEQLTPYRPNIYLGGAEPLVRDDFVAIAERIKFSGLPLAFTTNGTLLSPESIRSIVELGIEHLTISLDGPPDVHDALRGPGVFERVIGNLNEMLALRRANGARKPAVTINATVNPLVVGRLRETVESIRSETKDQVDAFVIHHLWFITSTELQAHQAAVAETLACSAPGARSHLLASVESIDLTALAMEISELQGHGKVTFFPDIPASEIRAYYAEGYRARKRCSASSRVVVVKPDGEVRFCPDERIDDYVLGNIRDERFEHIWGNEKARRFRSSMRRVGSFPGCQRCSWMHCF